MKYNTLTNYGFPLYYGALFSEAEKEEEKKLDNIEDEVDEITDDIEPVEDTDKTPDNSTDKIDQEDDDLGDDLDMSALDDLDIKEDKDKGDPDLDPISRKDTDTSSVASKSEDLSGMFSDIFESSTDMDDIETEDDSQDSDLNAEANELFDMDTLGGDDGDDTSTELDEDGNPIEGDDNSELDEISDSLDEEGNDSDDDIYGDIDSNSEVVDNASEIKRANLVKTKLLGLFNIYDQDIKALTDLKLPADKEKIYKPFLDEYKDLLSQLNDYIVNFTDKDSSFVMMRTLLMFKFLFSTLDNQTKVITDTIFPDKKSRKK